MDLLQPHLQWHSLSSFVGGIAVAEFVVVAAAAILEIVGIVVAVGRSNLGVAVAVVAAAAIAEILVAVSTGEIAETPFVAAGAANSTSSLGRSHHRLLASLDPIQPQPCYDSQLLFDLCSKLSKEKCTNRWMILLLMPGRSDS